MRHWKPDRTGRTFQDEHRATGKRLFYRTCKFIPMLRKHAKTGRYRSNYGEKKKDRLLHVSYEKNFLIIVKYHDRQEIFILTVLSCVSGIVECG